MRPTSSDPPYLEVEHESAALVEALVRADDQLECEQIVGVRKFGGARFGQIELVDVCGMRTMRSENNVQITKTIALEVCVPF